MGVSDLSRSEESRAEEQLKEKAREKENEELRERVKTLEKGWDAVVKALAAQGLPTGLPVPNFSPSENNTPQDAASPSPPPQPQSPPSAYPVLVPSTVFPDSPHNPSANPNVYPDDFLSTLHLARVATTVPSVSLQRVDSQRLRLALHLLLQRRLKAPSINLRRLTQSWKISSAKSSHPNPSPCHQRRLYLWTPRSSKSHAPRRRRRHWRA